MNGVRWDILANAPDVGGSFWQGFDQGQRRQRENALMRRQEQIMRREDEAYQRETETRNALTEYLLGGHSSPSAMPSPPMPGAQTNALLQPPAADRPAPAPAAPSQRQRFGPSHPAYERMVRANPEQAMRMVEQERQRVTQELDLHDRLMEEAAQRLATVTDQASLDAAREWARQTWARAGVAFDESEIPATYSPEAVRALQMRVLEVKDMLAEARQQAGLELRQEDIRADNDRQDRATDSLVGYRNRRLEQIDEAETGRNRRHTEGQNRQDRRAAQSQNRQDRRFVVGQNRQDRRAQGRGRGRADAGNGPVIVNPQTGQRMRVSPDGRSWVPVR